MEPVRFERCGDSYFADFGTDAYGTLQITFRGAIPPATLTVRLGERLDDSGAISRTPGGSINFREIALPTNAVTSVYRLSIPPLKQHQKKAAVKPTPGIGEITPFRYAEISGCPVPLDASAVKQLTVHSAFAESASAFSSSDDTLNAVWNLCKHTTEGWDAQFKPNLTWNHAWGSAPTNIISRYLVGVRPLAPGYRRILIAPRPASLSWFEAKGPAVRGPVYVGFKEQPRFSLKVEIPPGSVACISLPSKSGLSEKQMLMDGAPVVAEPEGGDFVIKNVLPGPHRVETP